MGTEMLREVSNKLWVKIVIQKMAQTWNRKFETEKANAGQRQGICLVPEKQKYQENGTAT